MVRLAESTNTTLARDGSHVLPRVAVVLCRLPRLGSTTANTAREIARATAKFAFNSSVLGQEIYPKEGTTAGALQHSYCERYEWILAARVVWGVFHVVWERGSCVRA